MTEKHAFPICVPYTESSDRVDAEITDRLSEPAYQMFKKNQLVIIGWELDILHSDGKWMDIWVGVRVKPQNYTLLMLSGAVFV